MGKRRKVERAGKDGVSDLEWEGWSLSDGRPLISVKVNLCVERVVKRFRGKMVVYS